MTIAASVDPHQPDEHSLDVQAAAALRNWFEENQSVAGEIREAARCHAHLQQEQRRESDAVHATVNAEQRAASLTARLDLAGHKFIGCTAGAAVVALLLLLDAIPLNWAAQAFGLAAAGTYLVTAILLVASAGAMAGLEATREDSRRRGGLVGLITAAYLALVILRTAFLTTVAAEPLATALLQAVLLSAISAGLVVCGAAVLARTRPPALARALAAARQARRTAAAGTAARCRAEEKMHRHWAVLQRMLREWLVTSVPPAGVSHADWLAAIEQALHAFFPGR